MNLQGVHIDIPVLTPKDVDDVINFACRNDMDFIAASFVQVRMLVPAFRILHCLKSDSVCHRADKLYSLHIADPQGHQVYPQGPLGGRQAKHSDHRQNREPHRSGSVCAEHVWHLPFSTLPCAVRNLLPRSTCRAAEL